MTGFYWLASYPKSGNTWLRLALRSLRHGGSPVDFSKEESWIPNGAAREPFDQTLDIESSDLSAIETEILRPRFYEFLARSGDEPILRKIHDAYVPTAAGEPLFPPAVTSGVVYIVRDPRDVAVSFAHHRRSSIDNTIGVMQNPAAAMAYRAGDLAEQLRQRLLTWSGHVESWLDAPHLRRLVLRYEDMLASPFDSLARTASFLGWEADPAAVAGAVEATRFQRLKAEESRHGFRENPVGEGAFFRRGVAGGWRDTLSSEQVRRIERDHGRVMRRLGYPLTSANECAAEALLAQPYEPIDARSS